MTYSETKTKNRIAFVRTVIQLLPRFECFARQFHECTRNMPLFSMGQKSLSNIVAFWESVHLIDCDKLVHNEYTDQYYGAMKMKMVWPNVATFDHTLFHDYLHLNHIPEFCI